MRRNGVMFIVQFGNGYKEVLFQRDSCDTVYCIMHPAPDEEVIKQKLLDTIPKLPEVHVSDRRPMYLSWGVLYKLQKWASK